MRPAAVQPSEDGSQRLPYMDQAPSRQEQERSVVRLANGTYRPRSDRMQLAPEITEDDEAADPLAVFQGTGVPIGPHRPAPRPRTGARGPGTGF